MKKLVITLPDHQAEAIERIRSQRGVPRSRIIQQALDLYLTSQQAAEAADDVYEAGYRANPERLTEIEAYTHTVAEILIPERWE